MIGGCVSDQIRMSPVLEGRTVLITRTAGGNEAERQKLEKLGARVIELTSIKIGPPSSWEKIDQAISNLEEFDWIIFTSVNGVKFFIDRCIAKGKEGFLVQLMNNGRQNPKFASVGPATKKALEELGFKSSFEPSEFLTSTLGAEFVDSAGGGVKGKKILLARAEEANKEITGILERSGAQVFEAPVYRTTPVTRNSISDEVVLSLTDITFTSPSTVDGFANAVEVEKIRLRPIRIHSIGPVTARAAEARGLKVSSVAKIHTIDGLIESLVEDAKRSKKANTKFTETVTTVSDEK